MPSNFIKQIEIGGVAYDLNVLAIQDGTGAPKYWSDITELIGAGIQLVPLNTLPAADSKAYASYSGKIVLIPIAGSQDRAEYIITRDGTDPNYTYAWEQIGTTAAQLDTKADKGTYTTAAGGTAATEEAGAFTATTSEVAGYTATGTASVSYDKATSIDDHTIAGHSHAVNATTASFTYVSGVANDGTVEVLTAMGDTSSTPVINSVSETTTSVATEGVVDVALSSADTTSTGAIQYTEDITGSAPSLTGTTTFVTGLPNFDGGSKAADSFTANVPTTLDLTKFNGGSYSQGEDTFDAGALASCTHTSANNVMQSATVNNGVLSWSTTSVVDAMTFTEGSLPSFTQGTDTFTAATLANGFYSAGSAASFTEGAFTPASLGALGTATFGITGGSYSATKKYVKATYSAAGTTAVINGITTGSTNVLSDLGQAGTAEVILSTGLATAAATFMTGATLDATAAITLSHSISYTTTTATGSASVAISAHTHTVEVGNHTHSIGNHTHNITLDTPNSNN